MKYVLLAATTLTLLIARQAYGQTIKPDELTNEVPLCKMPPSKRPLLMAERRAREHGYASLVADFNGDGWCDFAVTVPYPVNSKMESYFFEDILIIGGHSGWHLPASSRWTINSKPEKISDDIWPTQKLDLTRISLIYPKSGGAPYVLGLFAGYDDGPRDLEIDTLGSGDVYRWDDRVELFKKVDLATRDALLMYYCEHNPGSCKKIHAAE